MFRSYPLNFITFSSLFSLHFKYTLCVSCFMRNIQMRKLQKNEEKLCLFILLVRPLWLIVLLLCRWWYDLWFSILNQKNSLCCSAICNWITNFHSTLIIIWSWTVHLNGSVIVVVIAERVITDSVIFVFFHSFLVIFEERQKLTANENFGLYYNSKKKLN